MNIPGMGEVKGKYVALGGASLFAILGYAYYRNSKQKQAAASAAVTSTDAALAGTGAGSSGVDPSTGLPYADEGLGAASTYGGIDPATGVPYYDEITQNSQTTNPNAITTNQQWIEQAESDGQNLFGATALIAETAVGKYIAQTTAGLQPNEYLLMQQIVAELGQPPTGGPYRFIQAPGGPITGAGGGGGTKSIAPGEEIMVPLNIKAPNSMAKVATQYGIALQHLINSNPGSSAGTVGLINVPYEIQPGDTLDKLAGKFGIAAEHMAQILQSQGIV